MKIIQRREANALGLKYYFTGKPCNHGHVSERQTNNGLCVTCRPAIAKKHRENLDGEAKEARSEYMKKYLAEYREKNRKKQSDYYKKWRAENKERVSKQQREYRERSKHKIAKYKQENRDRDLSRHREWLIENSEKVAQYNLRPDIKAASFIRKCLYRLEVQWNRGKYEKILGYTKEDLVRHIESQFKPGMSWENRSEWHIDHVRPIKSFLDEGITDPAIINSLSNLQPLWAFENLSKGSKYEM